MMPYYNPMLYINDKSKKIFKCHNSGNSTEVIKTGTLWKIMRIRENKVL